METKAKPNYRPAQPDGGYESPKVLKIVEVPGPVNGRQLVQECVLDEAKVPRTESEYAVKTGTEVMGTNAVYLPFVPRDVCNCDSECGCDGYCSCDGYCTCNPQTYYHCTCNPQHYYHCSCNPQSYYYCTCNPQIYWY